MSFIDPPVEIYEFYWQLDQEIDGTVVGIT